jgi:hypothetical protein
MFARSIMCISMYARSIRSIIINGISGEKSRLPPLGKGNCQI